MQSFEDTEPVVRIRDLKKDRVNFVLENVDLACVSDPQLNHLHSPRVFMLDLQTRSEEWSWRTYRQSVRTFQGVYA
jgi:hypothetical protein